ncbi:hypothetical protein [Helicobacter sp. 13S00477-4]|uniref:hypothetical protein n=1 Tax=Helicobacter sp. 13S00477-4 TaxID=1905759 RepID=UPI001179AD10|nr:hypothetical protein [Helicobacter sp. 13S00477-4]
MNYTLLNGASSDIGKKIALTLSKNHSLLLSGRNHLKLQQTLQTLHNQKNHKILLLDLKEIQNIKIIINEFLKSLNGRGGGYKLFYPLCRVCRF